jgi:hypothetical protein
MTRKNDMFKNVKMVVLVMCITLIGTSAYGTICIYNQTDFDVRFYFDTSSRQHGPFTLKKRKDEKHATCLCTQSENYTFGGRAAVKKSYRLEAKDVPGKKKGWTEEYSRNFNKDGSRYVYITADPKDKDGSIRFSVRDSRKLSRSCDCKCEESSKKAKGVQIEKVVNQYLLNNI